MKNYYWMMFLIILGAASCSPKDKKPFGGALRIIPQPVKLDVQETGRFLLQEGVTVYAQKDHPEALRLAEMLASQLSRVTGWKIPVAIADQSDLPEGNAILLTTDGAVMHQRESYTLDVSAGGVIIRAGEGAGLFYGIETLKQLLPAAVYGTEKVAGVEWQLPLVHVEDYPRFSWRGLHLDVGRHMSSVEFLKKYLDNMAMHKLNTFHWHLTEDQGWRIEIKKYPKLTEIGAYRDETVIGHASDRPVNYDGQRYGGYYTQEEVKEIVAYAAERYITVVPEIEMPGHATAAIAAYPELGTSGERPEVVTTFGIFPDIFNVEDETFSFLENVLSEVMELFPGEYLHIGGDEAMKDQWESSDEIQAKIKQLGLKDEHELQSWFITRIERFVNSKGRQIIGWDEILEGGLAPNAAVMSWRGEEGGIAAAKSRHRVVMSPYMYLYFDYYQGDKSFEPMPVGRKLTLEDVYNYDPIPNSLTTEEQKYIIGVQANVWTEYMPNSEKVEYMVFPRIAALAEVAWSPENHRNWEDFKTRIPGQLARYEARRINYAQSIYYVGYELQADSAGGGVTVALTNQMGLQGMHYTTDGSLPDEHSKRYQGPFQVPAGAVVRSRLYVDGEAKGKITEVTVGEEE